MTIVQIELSDEAAAATKTALNRIERYDIARDINVSNSDTGIHLKHSGIARRALREYETVLSRTEGEPTLYDPNGRDVYLTWVRRALTEL